MVASEKQDYQIQNDGRQVVHSTSRVIFSFSFTKLSSFHPEGCMGKITKATFQSVQPNVVSNLFATHPIGAGG